ncbi:MAG: signal peptidase II [Gemmataceae bacterium]|nr:signal peptidase II [Gemmataceae bacterium]MDW8264023.1 signal peptidase II [Gemmataceae bacterium]
MNAEPSYRRVLWTLALLGLVLDVGSKYVAFRWLYAEAVRSQRLYGEFEVVPGAFRLLAQFTDVPPDPNHWAAPLQRLNGGLLPKVNHGAVFGLGRNYVYLANGVFTAISALAAVLIAGWSLRRHAVRDPWLAAALGLILGGTLGNLFDRIVFLGVRDFLYFYWIEWPVFNVADCCLVAGAAVLLLQAAVRPAAGGPSASPSLPSPEVAEVR